MELSEENKKALNDIKEQVESIIPEIKYDFDTNDKTIEVETSNLLVGKVKCPPPIASFERNEFTSFIPTLGKIRIVNPVKIEEENKNEL